VKKKMSLIEEELERRRKPTFKNKVSGAIENIKKDFREKKEFNKELKQTEKEGYKIGLRKEAKRYGVYKAKQKYSKKRKSKGLKFSLPKEKTPDFMKLPKNKEKTAFDW